MVLAQLLAVLPAARVVGPVDLAVGQIRCDSRQVCAGDVFVAVRGGQEEDRHLFVDDAVRRGACAVVVEEHCECAAATRVIVDDCRQALAQMACHYYGEPSRELLNIGVTGTNGKTTTAFLLRQVLTSAGLPSGYLGTLGFGLGGTLQKMDNTTPESVHLQCCLRAMVDGGQRAAVLEVSSHGLALQRVSGISFAAAVFTNLTRDHLDFHGSAEAYFAAKAQLFEALDTEAVAVLNADDPMSTELARRTRATVLAYGRTRAAQVRLTEVITDREGMRLQVEVPNGALEVRTVLTGDFNSYNVLAALATGLGLGLDAEAVCTGIASADSVPGRFERIVEDQDFEVIVDYAHTPDALARVLHSARDLTEGRLVCLFGCGGDRDRGKRSEMGRVASELADFVWVTSDNPRSEEPGAILDEIVAGMGAQVVVEREVDREQAIGEALRAARPGDVVLIAGKGHEAEQILANRTVPFDDRVVVRAVLRALNGAN